MNSRAATSNSTIVFLNYEKRSYFFTFAPCFSQKVSSLPLPIKNSTIYSFFRPWVELTARFFFKKIQIINVENIPVNKPVILIANHQNAMLDPVMLCKLVPPQLHWLTRADLFKKPKVNKLLRSINMLPVYRERDGVDDLKGVNSLTFEECNKRLRLHKIMCVFPEGSHRGKKQLVPLKKGAARIAMNALAGGLDNVCIVPVGLNYESHYNYRTSLLAIVGKPIAVKAITDNYSNAAQAQNAILSAMRTALKEVMIDIEDNDRYETILELEPLCNNLSESNELPAQFSFYHRIVVNINSRKENHTVLDTIATPFFELQKTLGINEKYFLDKGFSALKMLAFILGAIPALIGIAFFSPLFYFTPYVVKKIVKDPLFNNSIRFSSWMVMTPIYMLLTLVLLSFFSLSFTMVFAIMVSLLIFGIIALQWNTLYKQFKEHKACKQYLQDNNLQYLKWLSLREDLKKWIIQINSNS